MAESSDGPIHDITPVSGLYQDWFLDYASYVILERAVPTLLDGLKPVQRRILHALNEMDDGRYNKVANIIGATMQYHPHGDAAIGDAMVHMGQKQLLIDPQGNWGDVRTGDNAAAPRYIEARLSPFAKEVVFNPKITEWQLAYDGRKKEPVNLPVKFPLVLAQGVEGIAVGLSTRILPHNFCELIQGSIDLLRGKETHLLPDFPTGGMADFSNYNRGQKGGRVRLRARMEVADKQTVLIKEVPFGTTTTTLIDSILKANDQGKIKIKKVNDNTAKEVELEVKLAPGQSPDQTIDALYAFTDCEVSIAPQACVILEERPAFLSVDEILRLSTLKTQELLKRELEIRRGELQESLLFASLEKIFIENKVYRVMEDEEFQEWEQVIDAIDQGLEPYKADFYREITREDVQKLTEIKIRRISRYDAFKADEQMRKLQDELTQVEHNLEHLTDYAIHYFQNLLKKYGKGRERKTEIKTFDTIEATQVVAANAKLYVNRKEGFVGYGLKKDEFLQDCSDLDDIIVFLRDGSYKIVKIAEKVFVGKNILYAGVHHKDDRMTYNAVYLDGKTGRTFAKRFQVASFTREREYNLTKGSEGSKVLYFSANPNGEAEQIQVKLTQNSSARKKLLDFDFADLDIKSRTSQGNLLTKYPVKTIKKTKEGKSTLGGINVWYDQNVGKLNTEERGHYIGELMPDDQLLVFYKTGEYEVATFDQNRRFDENKVLNLEKFDPKREVSAIYYDGRNGNFVAKRFQVETSTADKPFGFIPEHKKSYVLWAASGQDLEVELVPEGKGLEPVRARMEDLAEVVGYKAVGNKLDMPHLKAVKPLPKAGEPGENGRSQLGLF